MCGEHDISPTTLGEDLQLIIDHIRVLHPDVYAEMEFWPDGQVVIHDETLTPEDFG